MRTLAIATIAAVVGSAAAQNVGQLPPLTAQVEVHVVNVDATVTDAKGNPVLDLTKDDFQIFEDGVLQKITNFAVIKNISLTPGKTAAASPTPADQVRRVLLIIDNNYLENLDRDHALETVGKYLDSSFNGEWAVAAIGHNVELVQPFTPDKSLVRAAITKVRHMPTLASHHEADRSLLSDRTRRTLDFIAPYDYSETVRFGSREQTFRNLLTMQNTARAVVDTARAYSAEDGKKFIILLTGGVESNTSYTAFDKKEDVELKELKQEMARVSDEMVREANAANFTVHVINARTRGMSAPQHDVKNRSSGIDLSPDALLRGAGGDPIDVADLDSVPLSIALGTGGMYLPSSDIGASMQRIDTATSNFYSLGYSPSHNGDRRYHHIKVRVNRPSVRIANRVGYYDQTADDRLEAMLRVRMTFDRGFGSLPVKVRLGQADETDRGLVLPVTTALPLARLTVVPQDEHFVGRVHVYCSVFDENGRNVGFHHQTQEVSVGTQELSGSGDFRYTMRVHLQKGAFTIVITLRDELSNEIGSASEAIRL
ncbi:MAG: VWA domain-containing protein [Acidobacteriota bacterium]|nr:VWA domain-containing protein [Acidobacteriota bacterium]